MDYYVPLLADNMYHITGHAVGREKLFLNNDNYRFFLSRFDKYISPVADIFAWSLLPNHFHLLIQVKPLPELIAHYKKIKPHGKEHESWQPEFVMKRFSNLFNSYAKAFNLKNKRRGALFMDYMRRVEEKTDAQFTATTRRTARCVSQNQVEPVFRYFFTHKHAFSPSFKFRIEK